MNALLLMVLTFFGYLIAYFTYGRFLSKHIFKLNPKRLVPSHEFEDGHDYVPTSKWVIFGHHFTSIAGTGPIVGPAIAILWGWLPAVLWVFFGSIFIGAVQDFAALVISMRNQGKSISDIAAKYVNKRVQKIFFIIVFFSLWIVLAIFGLVIASIFALFPTSVFPIWMQIPLSVLLGYIVYKKGGNLKKSTIIMVFIMYVLIFMGQFLPFKMPGLFGIPATGIWTILLLAYAFIASVLPVTTLLQPRDYLNAVQLYIILGLIILGIFFAAFKVDLIIPAPVFDAAPKGAPLIWPFLFITLACGAVSGFHSLVASGTSSKQISSEADAEFIGYGGMLIESFLAIIVIIAVTAGLGMAYPIETGEVLTGLAAWKVHYSSWGASAGLASKLEAVVIGGSNLMSAIAIPKALGIVLLGVFIASFAGTTLDSATRIQRYIITELFADTKLKVLTNKWLATGLAVFTGGVLAFSSGASGKGALLLWPVFGCVNQLLAGLSLMVITVYLRRKGGLKYLFTGIPCLIMLGLTIWASVLNQISFFQSQNLFLQALNFGILALAIVMSYETLVVFLKRK
ncbi:carbon starvation protein A [Candidatus Margulisiibacteriota bacterium]